MSRAGEAHWLPAQLEKEQAEVNKRFARTNEVLAGKVTWLTEVKAGKGGYYTGLGPRELPENPSEPVMGPRIVHSVAYSTMPPINAIKGRVHGNGEATRQAIEHPHQAEGIPEAASSREAGARDRDGVLQGGNHGPPRGRASRGGFGSHPILVVVRPAIPSA